MSHTKRRRRTPFTVGAFRDLHSYEQSVPSYAASLLLSASGRTTKDAGITFLVPEDRFLSRVRGGALSVDGALCVASID